MNITHDPLKTAFEIREQLASGSRRLVFFFGAGTSMAVGLPGIVDLTKEVLKRLDEPAKSQFASLLKEFPKETNVELVLNRIRALRELIGDSKEKKYDGLSGGDAKSLDVGICQSISEVVRKPAPHGLQPHLIFAQWLRALHSRRDWPVEVFTTNYDLFIEQAMEELGVPFFDGFVGSVGAFFAPESVEAEGNKRDAAIYPPRAWTRLWKLHGSINWTVKPTPNGASDKIVRTAGSDCKAGDELAIFPSRDKYSQSRKLPFLALQDRLRRSLSSGECLLVLAGYSYADQHLNEIIFQALRSNPHLAASVLLYVDDDTVLDYGLDYRNLSVYTPSKACVGGVIAPWSEPSAPSKLNFRESSAS